MCRKFASSIPEKPIWWPRPIPIVKFALALDVALDMVKIFRECLLADW